MTPLRRLDHVAIAVRKTDEALEYFSGRLGLRAVASEERPVPHVKLTYLDAGNALIQLIEPLDDDNPIATFLAENGEGLHHICFAVDDVPEAVAGLADAGAPDATIGGGRGRASAFVPGQPHHGVAVECTEFDLVDDVEQTPGWLIR